MDSYPRIIDPTKSFDSIVEWFNQTIIENYKCPGVMVGLSGTDSLVAFLAAYRAYEKAGKGNRIMGIHFAPSEDFLYDYPEAETHLWFSREVIPWIKQQAPKATIQIDTSIDWRYDGLRWGMMADMASVDFQHGSRVLRLSEDKFWVCGTRNRTEDVLFNYSNASLLAPLQPIINLWKSEVLLLAEHLGVPKLAVAKSCETDCICGRDWLRANHPKELDWVIMSLHQILDQKFVTDHVSVDLHNQLLNYITTRISKASFKQSIPYNAYLEYSSDPLIQQFEDGTLNIKEFNHKKHLYIAWYYLKYLPFQDSLERYIYHLQVVLNRANVGHKFSREITENYFNKLSATMLQCPNISFDEITEKV